MVILFQTWRVSVHVALTHILQVLFFHVLQLVASVVDQLRAGAFDNDDITVAAIEFNINLKLNRALNYLILIRGIFKVFWQH